MLKIGLTGGIGSGKSIVARVFETLGIPVYYADDAAKRLMSTDENLKESIIKNFGEECYKSGQLDRKQLASIVFNNKEKLKLLNSLIHPATIADANEWMKKQKSAYIMKEAALLFESGAVKNLDYVIGVLSPADLRIKRVMQRDGLTEKEVMQRIDQQMDEKEKMKRCDFIITNDEKQLVLPQILELDKKFRVMTNK